MRLVLLRALLLLPPPPPTLPPCSPACCRRAAARASPAAPTPPPPRALRLPQVDARLHEIMRHIYRACKAAAQEYGVSLAAGRRRAPARLPASRASRAGAEHWLPASLLRCAVRHGPETEQAPT